MGLQPSHDQESGQHLLDEDQPYREEEVAERTEYRLKLTSKCVSFQRHATFISFFLNIVLTALCLSLWRRANLLTSPLPPWPNTLYSPAQGAVEYKMVTFNSDFAEDHSGTNAFYSASPEANHAWRKLMDPYTVQITGKEAERISLPTSKISSDPDYYITNLDVYHQLHCLNDIRKFVAQHNSSEHQLDGLRTTHKFHCIGSIRQSLMCSADVSLVHWYWAPSPGKHFSNATTTHICRKWSRILEWAVSHRLDEENFDRHKFVE